MKILAFFASLLVAESLVEWPSEMEGFASLRDCKQSKDQCIKEIRSRQAVYMNEVFRIYLDIYNVRIQFLQRFGILIIRPPIKAEDLPVVVWMHDGGFTGGHYEDPTAVQFATQSNSIVMVIKLRFFPEYPLDAIIHDGLLGVSWATKNARTYGGNPSKISIVGHGTGVYVAAHVNQMLMKMDITPLAQLAIPFSLIPFEMTKARRQFISCTYSLEFWQNLHDTTLPPFPAEEFRHTTSVSMLLTETDTESHPLAASYLKLFPKAQTEVTACERMQTNHAPCLYRFTQAIMAKLAIEIPVASHQIKDEL